MWEYVRIHWHTYTHMDTHTNTKTERERVSKTVPQQTPTVDRISVIIFHLISRHSWQRRGRELVLVTTCEWASSDGAVVINPQHLVLRTLLPVSTLSPHRHVADAGNSATSHSSALLPALFSTCRGVADSIVFIVYRQVPPLREHAGAKISASLECFLPVV